MFFLVLAISTRPPPPRDKSVEYLRQPSAYVCISRCRLARVKKFLFPRFRPHDRSLDFDVQALSSLSTLDIVLHLEIYPRLLDSRFPTSQRTTSGTCPSAFYSTLCYSQPRYWTPFPLSPSLILSLLTPRLPWCTPRRPPPSDRGTHAVYRSIIGYRRLHV